jgi:hypothetical protein
MSQYVMCNFLTLIISLVKLTVFRNDLLVPKAGLNEQILSVRSRPKFVTHNYATGVGFGHLTAAEEQNLSVCFIQRRR